MRGLSTIFAASALAIAGQGVTSAHATPVYNEPISVVASFDDGTTLTGQFELNVYGYGNGNPWTFVTQAGHSENGTAIAGYTFTQASGNLGSTSAPNTIAINVQNGNYTETLTLTFAHALNVGGVDQIVTGSVAYYPNTPNSGECANTFTCGPSNERLIAQGVAFVPEPGSLAIISVAFGTVGLFTRRRAKSGR